MCQSVLRVSVSAACLALLTFTLLSASLLTTTVALIRSLSPPCISLRAACFLLQVSATERLLCADLLAWCLQANPDNRPPSMRAVLDHPYLNQSRRDGMDLVLDVCRALRIVLDLNTVICVYIILPSDPD